MPSSLAWPASDTICTAVFCARNAASAQPAVLQVRVSIDQLLGGVWTDNEAPAASLDWTTGEPTAKYWVVRLLGRTVGTSEAKELYNATQP